MKEVARPERPKGVKDKINRPEIKMYICLLVRHKKRTASFIHGSYVSYNVSGSVGEVPKSTTPLSHIRTLFRDQKEVAL